MSMDMKIYDLNRRNIQTQLEVLWMNLWLTQSHVRKVAGKTAIADKIHLSWLMRSDFKTTSLKRNKLYTSSIKTQTPREARSPLVRTRKEAENAKISLSHQTFNTRTINTRTRISTNSSRYNAHKEIKETTSISSMIKSISRMVDRKEIKERILMVMKT